MGVISQFIFALTEHISVAMHLGSSVATTNALFPEKSGFPCFGVSKCLCCCRKRDPPADDAGYWSEKRANEQADWSFRKCLDYIFCRSKRESSADADRGAAIPGDVELSNKPPTPSPSDLTLD